jgi:Ser/Thr protein kinase RdoA (MazF antagonist)
MQTALADSPRQLRQLCRRLALGAPRGELAAVYGGLHHRMWRLDTTQGSYAIKQLSPDLDFSDPAARAHFDTTEAIAEAFGRRGIPAVFALSCDGEYLQILEGTGYLVHPWREATALPLSRVSRTHALQVAAILARMHALALDDPGLKQQDFSPPLEDNVAMLVDCAQGFHIEIAGTLRRALPALLEVARSQAQAIPLLEQQRVISHGDLDQKNVLWDAQGGPLLIDWESARLLNPTYETLRQALNWSGITSRFSAPLFREFLAAYEKASGHIDPACITAAYRCVLGDWVSWLMYNVGRCLDLEDPAQQLTGQRQVAFTMSTLQHIMDRVPGLLDIPDPLAAGAV